MASNNPLIKAVKGPIIDVIEVNRKKIDPSLTSGVTSLSTWLPTTVDDATAAFQRTIVDITNRAVVSLPLVIPPLKKLLNDAADKLVAGVKAA